MKSIRSRHALYFNAALLGEVHSNLRAAILLIRDDRLMMRFIVDGEISDDLVESCGCAEAEFWSNYPVEVVVETEILRVDAPGAVPVDDGYLGFARYEAARTTSSVAWDGVAESERDERLALVGALVGNVWESLRYVSSDIRDGEFRLTFVNDGEIDSLCAQLALEVVESVSSRIGPGIVVTHEVIRIDAPGPLPGGDGWSAYRRWEGW